MDHFLVVGLGNYGREYENTRHNIGFMFLDFLDIGEFKKKDNYLYSSNIIGDKVVTFMKPLTFMNLSGEAIINFKRYYKINVDNISVIFDDIYLPLGKTRFRQKGGSGGHNGIKNIISNLGTENFKRIKIGVGNKPEGWDLDDWVISKFTRDEIKTLQTSFSETLTLLKTYVLAKQI